MTENVLQDIFAAEEGLRGQLAAEEQRLQAWLESVRQELAAECVRYEVELQTRTTAQLQQARDAAAAEGEQLLAAARRRCAWLASRDDACLSALLRAELGRLLPGRPP